jgi:hypothetical protein
MKIRNANFKMAQSFFDKMLRDPEIRMHYKQEKAKTHIAYAVRAARTRAGLTQAELAKDWNHPKRHRTS